MEANFRPRCPPRNAYLCFLDSGVYPAGGCRMRPKTAPEAAGCDPRLRRRLPDASTNLAGVKPQLWSKCKEILAAGFTGWGTAEKLLFGVGPLRPWGREGLGWWVHGNRIPCLKPSLHTNIFSGGLLRGGIVREGGGG